MFAHLAFGTYTRPQVQLLTVPVYAAACIYVVITAVFADRMKTRFLFLLFAQILMLVGFIINCESGPTSLSPAVATELVCEPQY